MKIAAIIPARYQSSRFPGKPLARIAGMTMIERVYRQAAKAGCFCEIVVATDDLRILEEVNRFGGIAKMTDSNINSGSERAWAVVKDQDYDAVVNVQGDEPLIPERLIFQIYRELATNSVVSAARRNDSWDDFCSPNVVKVVSNREGDALYFSRAPIPCADRKSFTGFFQHIGIYGYAKEKLAAFVRTGAVELERRENLEQLRFLYLGERIRIVQTDAASHGVDVPGDIEKIEKLLRS